MDHRGGKRVNSPRSGLFAELVQRIRAHNTATYGKAMPGNVYCGTDTVEPAVAAAIFEELVRLHVQSGVLRIERDWEPTKVLVEAGASPG